MKYIINENRLFELMNSFIDLKVDKLYGPMETSGWQTGLRIWKDSKGKTLLGIDDDGGVLYVDGSLWNSVRSTFGLGYDETEEVLKKWFSNKFPEIENSFEFGVTVAKIRFDD